MATFSLYTTKLAAHLSRFLKHYPLQHPSLSLPKVPVRMPVGLAILEGAMEAVLTDTFHVHAAASALGKATSRAPRW